MHRKLMTHAAIAILIALSLVLAACGGGGPLSQAEKNRVDKDTNAIFNYCIREVEQGDLNRGIGGDLGPASEAVDDLAKLYKDHGDTDGLKQTLRDAQTTLGHDCSDDLASRIEQALSP